MERVYNPKEIEQKWQKIWDDEKAFAASDDYSKPKYYALVEFPYPSGQGLHVGHPRPYTALDIVARKRRMEGYNVLFPIGFDAFGLPTENYAIKTSTHPRIITDKNIHRFSEQLKSVGFSFDWSRVIDTTDPDFYKWTQWIFLKMFEKGLVFRDKTLVNYCPSCKVVLSNEDSQGGKCDICHSDVVQRSKDVWYLRITEYADKLLEGLDAVDYPANIKQQQVNWIGKSTGAFVNFSVDGIEDQLRIYTTRPDTLYGVTFMVIAPEHPLIDKYKDRIGNFDAIQTYRDECAKKTEFERTQLVKDKTGVCIDGLTAINPVNGKKIPIFIADYVMMGYGTGAIMAVPAHDQRDYDFAKKFGIDIIQVIKGGDIGKEAYTGDGEMINSEFLNGYTNKKDSIERMLEELEKRGIGEKGVQYKMKDWAFNRQRYWGEPIPIIHCDKCGYVPLNESELPLMLPEVESYMPTDNGESPLAAMTDWVNVKCPCCGGPAKRETDTMPQWAGSSWYFLRYTDPHNNDALADPKLLEHWLPVDLYVGGAEHAVLHLLYARFWHKVLYDCGVVPTKEPFQKLFHQGMILGENNEKMSKSRGNVVNPDEIVASHGADALRVYEMFMGPLEASLPWSTTGLDGARRWLDRVWRMFTEYDKLTDTNDHSLDKIYNATVKKVTEDIESLNLNTAISQMMIFVNECYKSETIYRPYAIGFVKMFACFAPHLGEEIWHEIFKNENTIAYECWPSYDEKALIESEVEAVVQVNGKVRGKMMIATGEDEEVMKEKPLAIESVKRQLEGKEIKKIIVVKGKVVNIVAK